MNNERVGSAGSNRGFVYPNNFADGDNSESSRIRRSIARRRRGEIGGERAAIFKKKKKKKTKENLQPQNSFGVNSIVSGRASLFLSCIAAVDNIGKGDEQDSSVFSEFDVLNDAIQDYLLNSDDDCCEEADIFHVVKPFLNGSRVAGSGGAAAAAGRARRGCCLSPRAPTCAGALLSRDRGLPLAPLCVVVDLDETLVSARREVVHLRPHVKELLDACHAEGCEVVVWSAGAPSHVNNVVCAIAKVLERRDWYHHVISRHCKWYREDDEEGVKDLSALGRPLDKVLLLENNPKCIQKQPQHSVLVEDYLEPKAHDESLRLFASVVRRVAAGLKNASDAAAVDVPRLLAADAALIDIFLPSLQPVSNARSIFSRGLLYSPQKVFAHRCYGGRAPLTVSEKVLISP